MGVGVKTGRLVIAQQHDREDAGQRERETGRQEELGSEAQYDIYLWSQDTSCLSSNAFIWGFMGKQGDFAKK